MSKTRLLAVVFMCAGIVTAYAQQTTAPDQGTNAAVTISSNTTSTNAVMASSNQMTSEKEVLVTQGLVYNDGTIDYVSPDIKFKIDAKDDQGSGISNIYVMVDDSQFGIYDNPLSFFMDGKHMIAYKAINNVGNVSPIKYYEFILDKNPPKVTLTSDRKVVRIKDIAYVSSNVNFGIYAEDDYSGVKWISYKLDDGADTTYDKPFIGIQTNGLHKIAYKASDNVGNVSQEQTYIFYMDMNPPVVTFDVAPIFSTNSNNYISPATPIKINAVDAETAVADITYTVDDGIVMDYQGPFKLKGGTHTIKAKAVDLVGNISPEISITLIVDSTIPEADLTPTTIDTNMAAPAPAASTTTNTNQ
jgi:hypothetical protein